MEGTMNDENIRFQDNIINQINARLATAPSWDVPPSPQALSIVNILGTKEQGLWWRLYLNPENQKAAFDANPKDPGLYYDNDKSPGFQRLMTNAYEKYLVPLNGIDLNTLDWNKFLECFQDLTLNLPGKEYRERVLEDLEIFGTTARMADDSLNERVAEAWLVILDTSDLYKRVKALQAMVNNKNLSAEERKKAQAELDDITYVGVHSRVPGGGSIGLTGLDTATLHAVVEYMLDTLRQELAAANSKKAQLFAIVHAIRNLIMLHPFTDGNGRLTVYMLLPFLLLHHGFGLPLAGQSFGKIDLRALGKMFGGGFSIHDMAAFLWVSQDFGLQSSKKNEPTALKYPYAQML